jgi:hypothetical protein
MSNTTRKALKNKGGEFADKYLKAWYEFRRNVLNTVYICNLHCTTRISLVYRMMYLVQKIGKMDFGHYYRTSTSALVPLPQIQPPNLIVNHRKVSQTASNH